MKEKVNMHDVLKRQKIVVVGDVNHLIALRAMNWASVMSVNTQADVHLDQAAKNMQNAIKRHSRG